MYSDPVIVKGKRAYVKVYIDGIRVRYYNGRQLGINCNPNRTNSPAEKERALHTLSFELKKKLTTGWKPGNSFTEEKRTRVMIMGEVLLLVKRKIEVENISKSYRTQLLDTLNEFNLLVKDTPASELTEEHITQYLSDFEYSTSFYIYKRQALSAIFMRARAQKFVSINPVISCRRMKLSPELHLPFKQQQLKVVLARIKELHPKLWLCSLLMYGCFLRPHIEIRSLMREDFAEDWSRITLGGKRNKSKKIRTVLVPDFVSNELVKLDLDKGTNLFTGTCDVYGYYYFNTAWGRVSEILMKEGLIKDGHTLYSFRHTAAVNVYVKTKDVYKLQRMMGHSSLAVTLVYLRNLGLVTNTDDINDLPDL